MDAKSAAVLPNMKKGHRATVNFLIKQGASTNNLKEMNSILFSLLIQIGQGDLATGCSLNIVFFPQDVMVFLNSAISVGYRPAI